MPDKDKIMRAVCNGLNSLTINPWGGNTMATETVKNKLRQIGQGKFGCYVCASGVPRADYGEWLYDVTWLKYDCDGSSLIDAPLVAECEWGNPGDIDDDFQKLLLARASVRVMIFGGWDECGTEKKIFGWPAKSRNSIANATTMLGYWWLVKGVPKTAGHSGVSQFRTTLRSPSSRHTRAEWYLSGNTEPFPVRRWFHSSLTETGFFERLLKTFYTQGSHSYREDSHLIHDAALSAQP